MAEVYDWVGSLSLTPEHFQLLDYRGQVFLPCQLASEAHNVLLYMKEHINTSNLEDDEVNFVGFGVNDLDTFDDTLPLD